MFGFFSRKIDCFICGTKTKKKEAFDVKVDTAEGKLSIYACPNCAVPFNELLAELEAMKNGES